MKKLTTSLLVVLFLFPLKPSHATSYWDSFLEEAQYRFQVTIDFWAPKVQPVYHRTVEYWSPRLETISDRTIDYWAPRVQPVMKRTKEYWGREFQEEIHPALIKYYGYYQDKLGNAVARKLWTSIDYLAPKLEELNRDTHQYYQDNHPITYRFLADIPAFIKIGYEKFIIKIWQWLYTLDESEFNHLPDSKKVSVNMAMAAGMALKRERNDPQEEMLNQLLDEIKYHSFDYGMQECYHVVLFDFKIINAFSIGCNIFFSRELLEVITEPRELRAILAHELSHGDRGHGIKTLASLISTGAGHFTHMGMENLVWLATGEVGDYKDITKKSGHVDMIMGKFAANTPRIEIEADQTAAAILNRAGFSANDLIDALAKLHSITGEIDCRKEVIKGKANYRNYPNYCERREAILEVMDY